MKICRQFGVKIVIKDFHDPKVWPITETVDYGIKHTSSDIIGKVDADIILENDWLLKLLPHLTDNVVSVSSYVKTRTGKQTLDFLMWLRDINYKFAPLGRQPRGAARLLNRQMLEKIGGLDFTKPTFDTALDQRIRSSHYVSKQVYDAKVTEIRQLTLTKILRHQLSSGESRRKLGISFFRTLAHSIVRVKPFILFGYVKELIHE